MKNILSLFAILVISCMLSASALAQQPPYYAGAGIGQSYVEEDNIIGGADFDDEDFGFKVFGGIRLHENFAVEAAYLDFGETDDDSAGLFDIEVELYALALYGVGILPLSEQFELFAKLGVAYWDADADGIIIFSGITFPVDDDDGVDLAYGIGASYAFTDQFAVRVEYEGVDVDDLDTADLLTIGGEIRF